MVHRRHHRRPPSRSDEGGRPFGHADRVRGSPGGRAVPARLSGSDPRDDRLALAGAHDGADEERAPPRETPRGWWLHWAARRNGAPPAAEEIFPVDSIVHRAPGAPLRHPLGPDTRIRSPKNRRSWSPLRPRLGKMPKVRMTALSFWSIIGLEAEEAGLAGGSIEGCGHLP